MNDDVLIQLKARVIRLVFFRRIVKRIRPMIIITDTV